MPTVEYSSSYSVSYWGSISAQVKLTFSESYTQATNTTVLTLTGIAFKKNDSTNLGSIPVFGTVSVNGTTVCTINNSGSGYRAYVSLSGTGWCSASLSSVTVTPVSVVHNDDGSKSVTVSLSGGASSRFCARYEWYHQYATDPQTGHGLYRTDYIPFGVPVPSSASMALTTRPRGSTIVSYPSTIDTQGTFALSVSRSSSEYYHKATLKIGSTTMYTSDAFATSMSYTIPRSWFSSYPNDSSKTATVSVQTYTSSACTTTVGSPATANFTVTADAEMKPSVSAGWVSLAAYNTGAVSGLYGFIKGYSQAAATFNSDYIDLTDAVGASIASYSVTCQGTTVSTSPYRTPVLTQDSLVCTVTDTRGRTASETFTVTLMDYYPPTLTDIEVFRCDALGAADDDEGYYTAKATVNFASLNSQNVCPITVYHKAAGGAYISDGYLVSGQFPVSPPYVAQISADQTFSIMISATDSLGNTAEYYVTLPTRKWALKFREDGNGVAFGKAAETDATFEVSSDWVVKLGQPLPVTSGGTGANNAADARENLGVKGTLYFTSQAVAATTGDICTISDAAITADHVLVSCVFADPAYITTKPTWASSSGSLVINGTCSAATTVSVVLVPKDN